MIPQSPTHEIDKQGRIHASVIAHRGRGVLLCGASGAGKSDVALRLIADHGAQLVGDDYVYLTAKDNRLIARGVPSLAGLIEARGLGIVRMKHLDQIDLALAISLTQAHAAERIPDPAYFTAHNISIPQLNLCAEIASTPLKIIIALHGLDNIDNTAIIRLAPDILRRKPTNGDETC